MHIGGSRNMPHPARNSLCDLVVGLQIGPHHLHIDWRWNSKIQNLRHDVGWLEEELTPGKWCGRNSRSCRVKSAVGGCFSGFSAISISASLLPIVPLEL